MSASSNAKAYAQRALKQRTPEEKLDQLARSIYELANATENIVSSLEDIERRVRRIGG